MSDSAAPRGSPVDTSAFVKTHCAICAAGQTIIRLTGERATYCLLLRQWMTDKNGTGLINNCNRYERKETMPAE